MELASEETAGLGGKELKVTFVVEEPCCGSSFCPEVAATVFPLVLHGLLVPYYFPIERWSLSYLPLNVDSVFASPDSLTEMTLCD